MQRSLRIRNILRFYSNSASETIKLDSTEKIKKYKIINEIYQKTGLPPPPDNVVENLDTENSIQEFFSKPKQEILPKGVPELELLYGQNIPANLTLYSYRKKRWSNQVADNFIKKAHKSVSKDALHKKD